MPYPLHHAYRAAARGETTMDKYIGYAGNAAALLGIIASLIAGLARLSGSYYVFGYEAMTLMIAGIDLMVFACLARLYRR